MKKKIMAVTLCLAMVSTFAVGCGQKNETDSGKSEEKSSGKVEIEFVQVKREAAESYTKVIEAFEKENPDIVIKQNVVPDAQEVLMTRASSDSLPDMMNHWPRDERPNTDEARGNALRYSDNYIEVSINQKGVFTIKNSTKSLDDIDVNLLFNKFYTVDKSRTKGSSGLGLYIVKELLKKIDGKIENVSYEKNILSVSICFPLYNDKKLL